MLPLAVNDLLERRNICVKRQQPSVFHLWAYYLQKACAMKIYPRRSLHNKFDGCCGKFSFHFTV